MNFPKFVSTLTVSAAGPFLWTTSVCPSTQQTGQGQEGWGEKIGALLPSSPEERFASASQGDRVFQLNQSMGHPPTWAIWIPAMKERLMVSWNLDSQIPKIWRKWLIMYDPGTWFLILGGMKTMHYYRNPKIILIAWVDLWAEHSLNNPNWYLLSSQLLIKAATGRGRTLTFAAFPTVLAWSPGSIQSFWCEPVVSRLLALGLGMKGSTTVSFGVSW